MVTTPPRLRLCTFERHTDTPEHVIEGPKADTLLAVLASAAASSFVPTYIARSAGKPSQSPLQNNVAQILTIMMPPWKSRTRRRRTWILRHMVQRIACKVTSGNGKSISTAPPHHTGTKSGCLCPDDDSTKSRLQATRRFGCRETYKTVVVVIENIMKLI
jgi:hypothetical protein